MSRDPAADRAPRWRGGRGEWLVVGQIILIGIVFFGPRAIAGKPALGFPLSQVCSIAGDVLMALGVIILLAGLVQLGRGVTPLPYPKEGAALVQTGPFAVVRHPMYSGGLVLALGWALYVQSWLTLGYVVLLFLYLDMKAKREEEWLAKKYPEYAVYRQRVRKFIPFVY